jgi:hypothetical protein
MLRRNNILRGTSDKDFLRLIRSDSLYARQAVFTTKQVVQSAASGRSLPRACGNGFAEDAEKESPRYTANGKTLTGNQE